MQHERHDLDGDDPAAIWLGAQRRRTEDIYCWFAEIFKQRRQLKSPDTRPSYAAVLLRFGDGTKGAHRGQ